MAATAAVSFDERVRAAVRRANSLVCVGLDPDINRFPAELRELGPKAAISRFNRAIIEATRDLVCAYKPNLGFYAGYGIPGIEALLETRAMIPADIPVILDCKVGDIGSTSAAYARGYFDEWSFDCITTNPYLGEDSLAPFLSYPAKGVLVVCKTSNPGSGDLQDLPVQAAEPAPLFLRVASRVAQWDRDYPASVGLVVGATYPDQLRLVRERASSAQILLPGVGEQAGALEESISNGIDAHGEGLIVSASRSITYASAGPDFATRARESASKLRDAINTIRTSKPAPVT